MRAVLAVGLALLLCTTPHEAAAYTAAGDRLFAASGLLPQIAPADEIYTWSWTLPQPGGPAGAVNGAANVGISADKTITETFGFGLGDSWSRLGRVGMDPRYGWQNFSTWIKYLAINNHQHELLLSIGANREWGATGAARVGGVPQGATTPRIYFGKGLGDLDIGLLRPLAITGFVGYEIADDAPRPNQAMAGFGLQYSIPYLQSKVHAFNLPSFVRGLSPLTEIAFSIPAGGRSFGARTTVLIGPGVSYAGESWEFLLQALVPATRATGTGIGVRAQLHISLDFLFPASIGRPLLTHR